MNKIRPALATDASAILDIYAPYILYKPTSFETELPDLKTFSERIMSYQERWPWLVYESEGVIAGYAYAAKHRDRPGYQWCVETSVYISESFQFKGIATRLYHVLFHILKYQGCRNVYAGITMPNENSVHLHEKLGFKKIADYVNIGYKCNRWNTVRWYELQLNDYNNDPDPVIQWKEIAPEMRQQLLEKKME